MKKNNCYFLLLFLYCAHVEENFNTYRNFAATYRKFIFSFLRNFSLVIGFKRYGYLEYFGKPFFSKLKLLIIHGTLITRIIQIFADWYSLIN